MTKWVEVKALKSANEESISKFLNENICTRYGIPREIVIYQGSQFTSNLIQNLMKKNQITLRKSTPYHPHENGKIEVTKQEIEDIFTKVI